jgi:rhodanese-related sulfurtransferase
LAEDGARTLYQFDVRTPEEYLAGHLAGFRSAPGGQLVQETDHFAPVRGARIVLSDELGARAEMTASWLAQMAWEVYVLDDASEGRIVRHDEQALPPRSSKGRYKRPYEGTDSSPAAMRAYLEWEFGLVEQLRRDGTHGFFVV